MTKEPRREEITEREIVILPPADQRQRLLSPTISPPRVAVFAFLGTSVINSAGGHSAIQFIGAKPFYASGLTSKNAATLRSEPNHDDQVRKRMSADMLSDGARRGFTIATTNLLPNVVMAFVIIQALKITGLLDW